jgi:hypothetical protein
MKLSAKIQSIAGSQTVAFTALIQQLRQEGRKIMAKHLRISFAVSEENLKNGLEQIAGVL